MLNGSVSRRIAWFVLNPLPLLPMYFGTAGPSAPWTGMIKFTEEEPTGEQHRTCPEANKSSESLWCDVAEVCWSLDVLGSIFS